jgi:hypothetical protein
MGRFTVSKSPSIPRLVAALPFGGFIFSPTLANRVMHRLANRWKDEYGAAGRGYFPAWFGCFELEVIKSGLP